MSEDSEDSEDYNGWVLPDLFLYGRFRWFLPSMPTPDAPLFSDNHAFIRDPGAPGVFEHHRGRLPVAPDCTRSMGVPLPSASYVQ